MKNLSLYPPIEPYASGYLPVDNLHQIYWEESGNPAGAPVVFLHGGPGAGSGPKHRQYFDPKHYRIIIFDQRGAGRSKPFAELRQNTTALLVSDMEKLRKFLGIERWHVFGGSWGSTLALTYAVKHPKRCLSLVLRGIFLMTQREIDWFLNGIKSIFPEVYDEFLKPIPKNKRKNLLKTYYSQLTHKNKKIQLDAAKSWASYESAVCKLIPEKQKPLSKADLHHVLAIARIEAHYFLNNRFKPDNYLLKNVHKLKNIPTVIIQGRYDIVCPPETAWDLAKAMPHAKFIMIKDAGHSASEPGVTEELIKATNKFRKISRRLAFTKP